MNWKSIVSQVAPTIGTALGSPIAGIAISELLKLFGLSNGASEKDLEKIVLGSSDALLKIKEFEIQFKQKLIEAGLDIERIDASDRASARQREADLAKSGKRDYTNVLLACCTVCGWMFIQVYILTHVIAPEMREIVMRSLGTLDAALGMVFTYYFGSSKSSYQKDEIIKNKLLS